MRNLIFLLFASVSAIAQVNPTSFSKIKVTNQTKNNNATRVVVQDSITKEFHWVLKSNLGGGNTTIPTWHQTLTAGNITNIGAVTGVKAFEVTSPNTGMSFFGETILTSNTTKQAEYGLNGFIHKLNDNTQKAKLSYDGLELKTNVTGGVATIKSDNLTIPVTLQLPTTSGTLALTGSFVDLTSTQTNIGGTKAFTAQTFFNSGLLIGDSTNNFSVTYTPVTGLLFRETNIPRMTLGDRVLVIGNSTSGVSSRLDVSLIDAERTHFLPNKSGTIALTNDTTPLLRVANAAAIPLPSEHAGGVILLVEDSKKMYRNDGTKWQGL